LGNGTKPMIEDRSPGDGISSRGFTLIEMIIILGIMAILLTIAYPNFQRYYINGNLRSAARDIMGDISAMKEGAMAHNVQLSMILNKDANSYTIPRLPPGNPVELITKSPASFGQGVQLTGTDFETGNTITFLTRGTLSQGGNISLTNSRGSTATITCNLSGRTYVQFAMQ
jgi:prepilin-type N-terminal cleavage/methylation domain-containing protein